MTKESLEAYRSKKEEIKELQCKLLNINKKSVTHDTILDYRKGYPIPQAIVGIDPCRVERTENRYKQKIEILSRECEEVEDFIESINDSLTRRIFRLYFLDGLSQYQVSTQVHISQSKVSEKISLFLKLG